MDHDVLMMIYGALIGVGSSFITTLFQSWINRRETERHRKDEQKRKLQEIYIPTPTEVKKILKGDQTIISKEGSTVKNVIQASISLPKVYLIVSVVIILLICSGIVFMIYKVSNPLLDLVVAIIVGFFVTYAITKILKP